MRFGELLRLVRQRTGKSQGAFAALGGVSKNSQLQYEKGETAPSVSYLLKLRDAGIDVSSLWLDPDDIDAIEIGQGAIGPIAARYGLGGYKVKASVDELDLVKVNEIDLAYGFGGTYSDVPVETQVLHFPRTWLETITHTPPSSLTFARGRGDSMQPTLQDGDIVLIDRSIRNVREQDAVWALTVGDIAMIKRVRAKGERVSVLSDNDRVPPDEYHHEEINIVGRVIFIGRRI